MKKSTLWGIIGSVFCVLLSAVFIIAVVIVPFYYSITALTEPKTVAMVIQNVDYKNVIEQNPTIKSTLESYGIDSTEAQTIMKSKETGELIEIYTDEVTEVLLDIPEDRMLDIALIKEIVDENIDEVLDIAEENMGVRLHKRQIKDNVNTFITQNEQPIEQAIPVLEEVRGVVKTIHTSTVIEKTLSVQFAVILIAASFIVLAIIGVIKRSNGFLWIAIDFALISIILGLVIIFSRSNFISRIALRLSHFETAIIDSAISICVEKIIIAVFGTVIFTVVFLGFFVVLKMLKRKYQKTEYIQLPVLPTE